MRGSAQNIFGRALTLHVLPVTTLRGPSSQRGPGVCLFSVRLPLGVVGEGHGDGGGQMGSEHVTRAATSERELPCIALPALG